jgi:hypothetical protein
MLYLQAKFCGKFNPLSMKIKSGGDRKPMTYLISLHDNYTGPELCLLAWLSKKIILKHEAPLNSV